MSYKYSDNNEDLINAAGNTIFENIYQNCQHEVKDRIITQLLSKIEEQNKKINSLEKENKKLKDNFIYILKRILSNKEEYNINTNNKQSFIFPYNIKNNRNVRKSRNKSNNSRNNASYSINKNNTKDKYITNYSKKEISRKNKNDMNNSLDNLIDDNIDDNQKNEIIEAKAKRYLNDLYRKNFGGPDGTTPNSYFINKNISLYEELFPPMSKTIIVNEMRDSHVSPYKRNTGINGTTRNKSVGIRKKIILADYDKINHKRNKNNIFESSSTNERLNSIDKKNKKINYERNQNNRYKRSGKTSYNTESYKIINFNRSYEKRNPYLLHKF